MILLAHLWVVLFRSLHIIWGKGNIVRSHSQPLAGSGAGVLATYFTSRFGCHSKKTYHLTPNFRFRNPNFCRKSMFLNAGCKANHAYLDWVRWADVFIFLDHKNYQHANHFYPDIDENLMRKDHTHTKRKGVFLQSSCIQMLLMANMTIFTEQTI